MKIDLLKIILITAAVVLGIIVFLLAVIFIGRCINSAKYKIKSDSGIDEQTYIQINGIEQYISIRGEDKSNPVMIFIHGGPASPMGYVSSYYSQDIEKSFTVINYDQRGCGRTYYANGETTEGVNTEVLLNDLDAIADYARKRFNKDKVVIMGHSWGTILGTLYVNQHPEKVSAYIGVSQCVNNLWEGKIILGERALEAAKKQNAKDTEKLEATLERMKKVTNYDDMQMDDLITAAMSAAKYLSCGDEMSSLGQIKTGLFSPYMNLTDAKWFLKMNDNEAFFAMQEELMRYAFFEYNANTLGLEFEVPMYFIAGSNDCAVPQELTEEFCGRISAPSKAFVTIENTGHSMFMDNPEAFSKAVLSFFE